MSAYTIVQAYHEELKEWPTLHPADRALLMAFVFCLKLRLEGTDFETFMGPPAPAKLREAKP